LKKQQIIQCKGSTLFIHNKTALTLMAGA